MHSLARVVVAGALAACSTKHAAEPRVVSNTATTTEAERRACEGATMEERVCGPASSGSCGRHGDSLHSLDITDLSVTDLEAPAGSPYMTPTDRANLRMFAFDAKATREYRLELTKEAELPPHRIRAHCCYSQCSSFDDLTTIP
jgi:hypothetical protein